MKTLNMNTEYRIREMAEELRKLIADDNDAPRFVDEYMGDLFLDNVCKLESQVTYLREQNGNLADTVEELKNKIEEARDILF